LKKRDLQKNTKTISINLQPAAPTIRNVKMASSSLKKRNVR